MNENPYSNPAVNPGPLKLPIGEIRQVSIRPFDLFQRGFQLIQDQYWLFLGMTLVAMFIGSAIPMGILMGPMMVGLHMALAQKSDRGKTEFGILFKGFDKFGDALIAMLIVMGVALALMIPLGILAFFGIIAIAASAGGGHEAAVGIGTVLFFSGYAVAILFVSLFCYLPFLFTFQLIADKGLTGVEACKASWKGVTANLLGLMVYLLAMGFVNILLTLMCFVPVYLFMPISFASMFELYRDVYGRQAQKPLR